MVDPKFDKILRFFSPILFLAGDFHVRHSGLKLYFKAVITCQVLSLPQLTGIKQSYCEFLFLVILINF